jgi:hypothetical protein
MLNEIAADRTVAYLSKAFNWFAMGDDEFVSPIVRGMARVKPRERARERTLTDDETRPAEPSSQRVTNPDRCLAGRVTTRFKLRKASEIVMLSTSC